MVRGQRVLVKGLRSFEVLPLILCVLLPNVRGKAGSPATGKTRVPTRSIS
jgi:hypothetical protein